MKAVKYIRTCSNCDHIDGHGSLKYQTDVIEEYCAKNNIDAKTSFYDICDHDTDVLLRPSFIKMLKYLKDNNINNVVIESGGRLSRNCKSLLIFYRTFLQKENVNFICVDSPVLFNKDKEPTTEFINSVLFSLIEYQENEGLNIMAKYKFKNDNQF